MTIQLSYLAPADYTGQNGAFTVDGNIFKTVNNRFFQKEINDEAYYYVSCSSTTAPVESNFFMEKYTKPEPDVSILELTIFKRHDYQNNQPVTDSLRPGLYDVKIDMYWGVFNNELSTLDDVLITNLQDGEVLKWDSAGVKWVNAADQGGPAALGGLSDVTITGASLNQVLTYNGAGQWINQAAPAPSIDLNNLTDVNVVAPSVSEVLTYTGAEWTNQAAPVPSIALNDLTDVGITSVGAGDDFAYNVGLLEYENIPGMIKKGVWVASIAPTSTPAAGEFSIVDGVPNTFHINEIDKLGRNFAIQLSNWFIPHVRDMSFYSSSAAPLVLNIDSPLLNTAGVWSAQTQTASIALNGGAVYRGELDAQHLLYNDKNNNLSTNQADDFGTGMDNISIKGDFLSGIASGSNNTVIGSNASISNPAANNIVLLGTNANSGFDNSICLGVNASAVEANSLTLSNQTVDTSAAAGANGAPPVSVEGYLRVQINGVVYKLPLYV